MYLYSFYVVVCVFSSDACWVSHVTSNGEISMECDGKSACQSATIVSYKEGVVTNVNCTGMSFYIVYLLMLHQLYFSHWLGFESCTSLSARTPSDISFKCDGGMLI